MITKMKIMSSVAAFALVLGTSAVAEEVRTPTVMSDEQLESVVAGNAVEALNSVLVELNDSDALFLYSPNLCRDGNACTDALLELTYGGDACGGADPCDKHPVFYTTIGGSAAATPPTYSPAGGAPEDEFCVICDVIGLFP